MNKILLTLLWFLMVMSAFAQKVTVKGTVSEDSYVCVYLNSEAPVSSYRRKEVNESSVDIFSKAK